MDSKNIKTIAQIQAERRELDRSIRAAKRSGHKAGEDELIYLASLLGAWLAESVGADSIEALAKLRAALESEQIQQHLRQQLLVDSSNMSEAGDHHDPVSGEVEGGGIDDLGQ